MLIHLRDWLITLLEAFLLTILLIAFVAQSFLVEGYSMEPTLHNGERVMVEKITYRLRSPKRGEIVIIKNPLLKREKYIKRIVGLPGDIIEINKGSIYINGVLLEEDYIAEPVAFWYSNEYLVPKGHVFVLGDNRNHSDDSRRIGPIPLENVLGRVVAVYWPLRNFEVIKQPTVMANFEAELNNKIL